MIKLEGITLIVKKKTILNNLSFSIREQRSIGIVGNSGEGKSELIRIILGITNPTSGKITYEFDIREKNKLFGICLESDRFEPLYTVGHLCNLYREQYGIDRETFLQLLERFKLIDYEDKLFLKLTHNEKNKVNLLLSSMHNPQFLFVDEVTTDLDLTTRNEIFNILREIKNSGTAIVYVSCYLEEIWYLCDDILLLNGGDITYMGARTELASDLDTFKVAIIDMLGRDK